MELLVQSLRFTYDGGRYQWRPTYLQPRRLRSTKPAKAITRRVRREARLREAVAST